MSRLRHPIRAIREPFGKAGLIVACLALVLALTGAAFAAGGLTKSQEKQVRKLAKAEAKKFAGKPGAAGATGPSGPTGPAGANGKDGAGGAAGAAGEKGGAGPIGPQGPKGEQGDPGESPVVISFTGSEEPSGSPCKGAGGTEIISEGVPSTACNGQPWAPDNVLPAGATLTGVWSFSGTAEKTFTAEVGGTPESITIGNPEQWVPISFSLPLAANLAASQVHFSKEASFNATACPKAATPLLPEALPGNLCVYDGGGTLNTSLEGATYKSILKIGGKPGGTAGASNAGALLLFNLTGAKAHGNGTFAVTAPDPLVTAVSPSHGPAAGGTSVTITGTNLQNGTVKFGTTSATGCTVNTAGTEVTCAAPAGIGKVDATVTVAGYTSPTGSADAYTYE